MVVFGEIHLFLQCNWIGLFGGNRAYLHLQHFSFRKYSFQKLTEFSKGNNVLASHASFFFIIHMCIQGLGHFYPLPLPPPLLPMLLIEMVFFREILVILQLSWIGLCGANWAHVHLETPTLQEVFLWKHKLILTGNNMLDAATSSIDGLFGEIHVFLQLGWIGLFAGNRPYLHLEHLSCWKYSFKK
jgi:hypothetical protein